MTTNKLPSPRTNDQIMVPIPISRSFCKTLGLSQLCVGRFWKRYSGRKIAGQSDSPRLADFCVRGEAVGPDSSRNISAVPIRSLGLARSWHGGPRSGFQPSREEWGWQSVAGQSALDNFASAALFTNRHSAQKSILRPPRPPLPQGSLGLFPDRWSARRCLPE
jgi:hypothetical protein